ncbi:unnamed protein product [Arctia plantaginis]|uniref:PiggyBac transposable element-derived protein domain-containing protein n=1 Tax=Arctia plantaginis TaxID=874455 RepID=A0A8S0YVW1_ARCPL|nr:unnamed protein product [Arctia plantaginis]
MYSLINAAVLQPTVTSMLPDCASKSFTDKIKSGEIKMACCLAEHSLKFSLADDLKDLIQSVAQDSNLASELTFGRTKAHAIVTNVTGKVAENQLIETLQKNKFSLIVDESTDRSSTKHLALIVRTAVDFQVEDSFLCLIPVVDGLCPTNLTELDREWRTLRNTNLPFQEDQLIKADEFWRHISKIRKGETGFSPDIDLFLDESLMLFRCRLVFRQYIKSKKARYGIKFYELTTADGYVLNIYMYCGKDHNIEPIETDASKLEQTVFRLFRPHLYKGHNLYMDNYYNSVTLSKKLLNAKTYTNGTPRGESKGKQKHVVTQKLKRGKHIWKRHGQVYVSKWQDQRQVLMITTRDHPHLKEVNNRYGQKKIKPVEVEVYNRHMSALEDGNISEDGLEDESEDEETFSLMQEK